MRLKKLTCGVAVLGMSAGAFLAVGATAASAATTNIRPYISGYDPAHVTDIGQTDPGVWDNSTCFAAPDAANPGNNGKINGVVVSGHAGQLNVTEVTYPALENTTACAPIDIGLTGTLGQTDAIAPKTGGTVLLTTTADLQGGISASSQVTLDVTLQAGQTLKNPTTAAPLAGTTCTGTTVLSGGPCTARVLLKASAVKTKAVAAVPASCQDQIYVMDTTQHDVKGAPIATVWDGSTIPPATSYFATIRSCAGDPSNIPGKPIITKLAITGNGTTGVKVYEAQTIAPATWDQTQGTCAPVKTTAVGPSFGSTIGDVSRVLQCKGNYGTSIPFALDVRPFTTNSGQDPFGLVHPAELTVGNVTFP